MKRDTIYRKLILKLISCDELKLFYYVKGNLTAIIKHHKLSINFLKA